MVLGVLTCCALLQSVCDLKAAQMNMQFSLIGNSCFMSSNCAMTLEATKNICWVKDEVAVDHSTLTRWFKNLNYETRWSWPKTLDSKAVLQAIEINLMSRSWGKLGILQFSVVHYLWYLDKKYLELLNSTTKYQNVAKLLTHPNIW